MNGPGAIAAMTTGLLGTIGYISHFKFWGGTAQQWWFGISPEGIGFLFMWLAAAVGVAVAAATAPPPQVVQDLVEDIRIPGNRTAHGATDAGMAPLTD